MVSRPTGHHSVGFDWLNSGLLIFDHSLKYLLPCFRFFLEGLFFPLCVVDNFSSPLSFCGVVSFLAFSNDKNENVYSRYKVDGL